MKTKGTLYIVKDWAGNILDFKGSFKIPDFAVPMTFKDADSAWEAVYSMTPENDETSEMYVEAIA